MRLKPHSFTLRQLQYAVALEDALSFHAAARLCHVSQPALSAQLARLESALGTRLFERDRRRVLVTSAGSEILPRVRRLLVEANDLADFAARRQDPLAGTLRIGVIPTISPYLLPAAAPRIRRRFPKLDLRWIEEKTATLVLELQSGALDAALLALEADVGDVVSDVIARDPFVLMTALGNPVGGASGPATAADLENVDVLLLDDGHCFREQALAYCSRAKARELEFRATSLPTLAQMVAQGGGVTLLPQLAVATETARAPLQTRRFGEPAPFRTIALVWRRGYPFESALRKIAAAIRESYPASVGSVRESSSRASTRRRI